MDLNCGGFEAGGRMAEADWGREGQAGARRGVPGRRGGLVCEVRHWDWVGGGEWDGRARERGGCEARQVYVMHRHGGVIALSRQWQGYSIIWDALALWIQVHGFNLLKVWECVLGALSRGMPWHRSGMPSETTDQVVVWQEPAPRGEAPSVKHECVAVLLLQPPRPRRHALLAGDVAE